MENLPVYPKLASTTVLPSRQEARLTVPVSRITSQHLVHVDLTRTIQVCHLEVLTAYDRSNVPVGSVRRVKLASFRPLWTPIDGFGPLEIPQELVESFQQSFRDHSRIPFTAPAGHRWVWRGSPSEQNLDPFNPPPPFPTGPPYQVDYALAQTQPQTEYTSINLTPRVLPSAIFGGVPVYIPQQHTSMNPFNPLQGADSGPPPPGFATHGHLGVAPAGFSWRWQPGPGQPAAPLHFPQVGQQLHYRPAFTSPTPTPGLRWVYQPAGSAAAAAAVFSVPMAAPAVAAPVIATGSGSSYIFPQEHVTVKVLKCSTPPWEVPPGTTIEMHHTMIPCCTTVADVMKGFGATNEDKDKNVIYEVVPRSDGKWMRAMTIKGSEKDKMKKTIRDIGWSGSRGGSGSDVPPPVWLWITKG